MNVLLPILLVICGLVYTTSLLMANMRIKALETSVKKLIEDQEDDGTYPECVCNHMVTFHANGYACALCECTHYLGPDPHLSGYWSPPAQLNPGTEKRGVAAAIERDKAKALEQKQTNDAVDVVGRLDLPPELEHLREKVHHELIRVAKEAGIPRVYKGGEPVPAEEVARLLTRSQLGSTPKGSRQIRDWSRGR